jgi:hypothetical protein
MTGRRCVFALENQAEAGFSSGGIRKNFEEAARVTSRFAGEPSDQAADATV